MKNKTLAIGIGLVLAAATTFADNPWSAVQKVTTFRSNDHFLFAQPDLTTNAWITGANFWAELTNGLVSSTYVSTALTQSNAYNGTFTGNAAGVTNLSSASLPAVGYTNIYRALITQTGTAAPQATVLQNTFGGTPTWSRTGVGHYSVTLAGNSFPTNKTSFKIDNWCNLNITILPLSATTNSFSIGTLIWPSTYYDGQLGYSTPTAVEIMVFP